jgi:hypothetical protein
MDRYRLSLLTLLGLCLGVLPNCVPHETAASAEAQLPPIAPGTARVWFFRGWDASSGQTYVYGAAPAIFANGAPIGTMPTGTDFFRDFPPGNYTFTVQPYGLPTAQAVTLQLAPGTQTYLQIQWAASWQFGYPEVDFSFAPNTFVVQNMSPQVAQPYLATLAYLGQR